MASNTQPATKKAKLSRKPREKFFDTDERQALQGAFQQVDIHSHKEYKDLQKYLQDLMEYLTPKIVNLLEEKHGLNFWLSISVKYTHPNKEMKNNSPIHLHSGKLVMLGRHQLEEKLQRACAIIYSRNTESIRGKSGLVIKKITAARFKVVDYLPLSHIDDVAHGEVSSETDEVLYDDDDDDDTRFIDDPMGLYDYEDDY